MGLFSKKRPTSDTTQPMPTQDDDQRPHRTPNRLERYAIAKLLKQHLGAIDTIKYNWKQAKLNKEEHKAKDIENEHIAKLRKAAHDITKLPGIETITTETGEPVTPTHIDAMTMEDLIDFHTYIGQEYQSYLHNRIKR